VIAVRQRHAVGLLIVVAMIAAAISARNWDARNEEAKAKGFATGEDFNSASKAGFATDPSGWKELLKRDVESRRVEAEAKRIEAARFAEAVIGAASLRQQMKNPDSFKLERTLRMDDGSHCYSFRATNSFNAIVPGQAVIAKTETAISGDYEFARAWNRHCIGLGTEVRNVATALDNFKK
jgi:hypothetical protein